MSRRAFAGHTMHLGLVICAMAAMMACQTPPPNPKPVVQAPPVVSALVAASSPPVTSSVAPTAEPPSSLPPPPPDPVPSKAVTEAANHARSELTNLPSEFQGEAKRECSSDVCIWNFGFAAPGKNGQNGLYGIIGIDEKSLAATFRNTDGEPLPISVYVALVKHEGAVVKAAAALPEVKRMCANSSRQGAPCTIYSDQMPNTVSCPKNPAPTDGCLWGVYVGSNMGTHVSRLATIYVDPIAAKVIGIADLVCPPISPDAFRAREVRRAAKPPDDDHYCD